MNSDTGACEYCNRDAPMIAKKGDPGIEYDVYVCGVCMNLLKNPLTALSLIRGHLSIESRGKHKNFHSKINDFMDMLSKWHTKN